jgi:allophanate hydrolase
LPETISEILAACRGGRTDPARIVARSYARVRALNDSAVFISLRVENEVLAEARKLAEQGRTDLPLYGISVAVKDNIDALGLPTTAACPAFSYRPGRDATAVARLREAGAVIIGKTNLDQFATGLVGLRSPYGAPRNSLDPALVPGGSSSGSAVAVATGIVPMALGTDTAGSGRVPALLNNIVGLKPSLGLVSNAGVVPACRTLDCASPVKHDAGWCERQQSATAPITCDSPRHEGGRRLCAGGYALPIPRPSMRRRDQGDRSCSAASP